MIINVQGKAAMIVNEIRLCTPIISMDFPFCVSTVLIYREINIDDVSIFKYFLFFFSTRNVILFTCSETTH